MTALGYSVRMTDRTDLRPSTRLQILTVTGRLTSLPIGELQAALAELYASQPMRWQTFMDDAQVLIDEASIDRSGFPETV